MIFFAQNIARMASASAAINNAAGISSTISANTNSISSLSNVGSQAFTNSITSNVTSAVNDPIAGVLNKSLSRIANLTPLIEGKINDLTTTLASYVDKNSNVTVKGNDIIITVSSADAAKGQVERRNIETKITSIQNTIKALSGAINSLNSISRTISVIQSLLNAEEALIGISPIAKTAFSVFKKAIKVVFLGNMLSTYSKLISSQLQQSSQQLEQFTERFLSLQVSLNIQDNLNQGTSINTDQAEANISQALLSTNASGSSGNLTSQTQNYTSVNGKTYIFKVESFSSNQLIGKAYEQVTGLVAAETAPSFVSIPADFFGELQSIVNSQ